MDIKAVELLQVMHGCVLLGESDSEERMDIAADQLRLAIRQLGKITGRVDIEDILGVVFSSFCIGK